MEKLGIKAIWREFKAYIIIAIGLLSYCLGWDIFLIPNHMVGGGVTGISAILLYAFGIPVSISFFIINTVLLAIALKVLGKSFGFKTVFATVVVSLYFQFLPQYIPTDFIVEFATSNGKLVCAICGGALAGVGIGICFSVGGSTGGTDIVALIITKYRNVSPGRVILLIDIFIIASSRNMSVVFFVALLAGAERFRCRRSCSGGDIRAETGYYNVWLYSCGSLQLQYRFLYERYKPEPAALHLLKGV